MQIVESDPRKISLVHLKTSNLLTTILYSAVLASGHFSKALAMCWIAIINLVDVDIVTKVRWKFKIRSVGAKRVFLQPQLLRNIDSIIQSLQFFFWQFNHYLLDERDKCCFLWIASKSPVRIQQNFYTQYLNGYISNLQNFIFSWRMLCEKMKIKVPQLPFFTSNLRLEID